MKRIIIIFLILWPLSAGASIESIIKNYEFTKSIEQPQPDILNNPRLLLIPSICPVRGGYITSGFGRRRPPCRHASSLHKGIDISKADKRNVPVVASGGGTIVYTGRMGGYGNTIIIEHWDGVRTQYGHLKVILVRVGDTVSRWDKIGVMGSTGVSTAPHLDYKVLVRKNGRWKAVDPLDWIQEEVPFKYEI